MQKPEYSEHNLIWLDLEMTGLEPGRDRIIEIATVITNPHLDILAEGPVFAIHQPDALLNSMDEWNTTQHGKSGLIERVRNSDIIEEKAELLTIRFLEQYVPPGKSPLCGSTICQDRRFLHRYMPKLIRYFHYRNLDVSSVKILAKLWASSVLKERKKPISHLALQDIRDSIEELQHYRDHFFKLNEKRLENASTRVAHEDEQTGKST